MMLRENDMVVYSLPLRKKPSLSTHKFGEFGFCVMADTVDHLYFNVDYSVDYSSWYYEFSSRKVNT